MELGRYQTIFWDFDGVIKDSMPAKAKAFYDLFLPFGEEIASKALEHHRQNGGMSRLVKIPLYYEVFLGRKAAEEELAKAMERFAELSWEATLQSPYVPGAYEYLRDHHRDQAFYVVTGTPESEILESCRKLGIAEFFQGIYGAPREKEEIIASLIREQGLARSGCLMIGDARMDRKAALANGIDFLLRETEENLPLFQDYPGPRVRDFL